VDRHLVQEGIEQGLLLVGDAPSTIFAAFRPAMFCSVQPPSSGGIFMVLFRLNGVSFARF
jgi:hypothetical protein